MARPWPKRSAWPYRCRSGRKSYTVGFYDHDRRERCRTFPSVRHARAWMDDYITAERRGRESLRRFLLDLDAKEANEREGRSIGAVLELYLQVNAHPRNEGGLAPTTYERYESIVNRHLLGRESHRPKRGTLAPKPYAVAVAAVPAVSFNGPQAPRAWREQMVREGVSKATRGHAWRVLSAALSWAVVSNLVPEIEINGCSLASEPRGNRRRSLRAGGTGYTPSARRSGPLVASWALSPQAVEAIRRPTDRRQRVRHQPEDAQRHYAFAIDDLRQHGPRPPDVEWRAARTAQADRHAREQTQRNATDHESERHRGKLLAWLSARRSASRLTDQQPGSQ